MATKIGRGKIGGRQREKEAEKFSVRVAQLARKVDEQMGQLRRKMEHRFDGE